MKGTYGALYEAILSSLSSEVLLRILFGGGFCDATCYVNVNETYTQRKRKGEERERIETLGREYARRRLIFAIII